ncbi:MAG: hypothetical protein OJF59_000689 [Cytophagales bacterium]|jgi:hypothetical protein|nr:hypothetical protein [Bacteroidota bacterium]MBS1979683.1 hypothetical protein [Bacteroidota bacterium]WHZ06936.1 MAG: hypothetical protein OJF59_000689 [Cytophagales bacterium]
MKKLALIIFWGISCALHAQTNDSYDYTSEFNWGINKNSYGGLIGGFTLKKARRLNDKIFETFGLELMNVKNPHEVRMSAYNSGSFFIWGKTNYLYAIRLQYGRDRILFKKGPQQGVEVKAVFAVGPTIGVVTPYYVQVDPTGQGIYTYNTPYNGQPYTYIQGTGNLFEGIGQSKIQMGGNFKVALNFELGVVKSQVTGFEAGFLLDAYFKKVPLMGFGPGTTPVENYSLYPTVFLTIFYGSRN